MIYGGQEANISRQAGQANQQDYNLGALRQQTEDARAVTQAMTQLACVLSDLDTAVRTIAGRISPLLPAGSPYNRIDSAKQSAQEMAAKVVRSQLCEQIHDRIAHINTITVALNEMSKSVEI